MATYLTLTNLVCKRVNEAVLDSSTFANAAGAHSTIKDAINAAIREINHQYPEWPWNRVSRSFTTVAGTSEYTPASDVGNIDWDTFYIERDDSASPAITAASLPRMDYTQYAQQVRPNDQQTTSDGWKKPDFVVRSQSNTVVLSPFPDQEYTVNYEAWTIPDDLSAYNDLCSIPDKYNHVIVECALRYIYQFRDNQSARAASDVVFKNGLSAMLRIEIHEPVQLRSTMIARPSGSSWVLPPRWP